MCGDVTSSVKNAKGASQKVTSSARAHFKIQRPQIPTLRLLSLLVASEALSARARRSLRRATAPLGAAAQC